ncbi:hypothetical protein M422DRAFT_265069 [Sphaerobolus stellatus SS14]|uniref:Uncharacterized protein n=1 Tax=Sphaerobolus stellatus (strain SS14) TaxID=990650 RepID=A0A0C9UE45_SPHS4|nr:hypothetical protein M422DRAFT_265069 [Sphaerobolus stellatus SS14]
MVGIGISSSSTAVEQTRRFQQLGSNTEYLGENGSPILWERKVPLFNLRDKQLPSQDPIHGHDNGLKDDQSFNGKSQYANIKAALTIKRYYTQLSRKPISFPLSMVNIQFCDEVHIRLVNAYNEYMTFIFGNLGGIPADYFGPDLLNNTTVAAKKIQLHGFSETEGAVAELALKIGKRQYGISDIPEGYFYFPMS